MCENSSFGRMAFYYCPQYVPNILAAIMTGVQLKDDYNLESRANCIIDDIMLMFRFCLNESHYVFLHGITKLPIAPWVVEFQLLSLTL